MRLRYPIIGLLVLLLFGQLGGCYYMQAIRGHTDMMNRRQPVSDVIEDETTPQALRDKLALISEARDFSITELGLPDNGSYRSYADVERDYVVWNVFAAPEFSLEPKTWCYPVAGCVAYRGYFREESARKQAAKLERDGYDVVVGGVAAYSTLGRFEDPLLNTMMRWSEVDLAATMFHELAHQKIYIKGDTAFNESFATAVAGIGVDRWLTHTGEQDRLNVYEDYQVLRRRMMVPVAEARESLKSLYAIPAADMNDVARRTAKQAILDQLSAEGQQIVDQHGGGRRNWLAPPLNNARLMSLTLYEGWVSAFRSIYVECNEDLGCFYARTVELASMPRNERETLLDALSD